MIADLTTYLWNWFIYLNAVGGVTSCWIMGGWGLFWDDDDGLMMDTCFKLYNGSNVVFPVEYSLN